MQLPSRDGIEPKKTIKEPRLFQAELLPCDTETDLMTKLIKDPFLVVFNDFDVQRRCQGQLIALDCPQLPSDIIRT